MTEVRRRRSRVYEEENFQQAEENQKEDNEKRERQRGLQKEMNGEEFVFRGLPWGINIPEARALLQIPNIETRRPSLSVSSKYLVHGHCGIQLMENNKDEYNHYGLMATLEFTGMDNKTIRVAEHNISGMTLYFAFEPKDGELTYLEEDTKLYAATYRFSQPTVTGPYSVPFDTTINELKNKLTMLYGESDQTDAPFTYNNEQLSFQTVGVTTHWYGGNDTEIGFTHEKCIGKYSNMQYVNISYVWHGIDAMMKEADAVSNPNSKIYKRLFLGCAGL